MCRWRYLIYFRTARLFTALVLLLLCALCSKSFALRCFQTSHEAALFLGLAGIGKKLFANFILVDALTENVGLHDSDKERQQVVVAQAGGVIVEEEQEHYRHHVGHDFHARHIAVLRLALHAHLHVYNVYNRHKEAEQAHVVSVEGYVERQGEDIVRRREIVCPQERLAAQLDCRWEEGEHGNKYRHLEQHGQAAGEGACAYAAVKGHRFLLALHRVGLVGIFFVDFLNFGSKHAHLCLALEALEREGEYYQLYKDCEQQDNYAVVADERAEECEHRNNDDCVDPTE